jgi:uncharacterized protein (TIGR02145 family)
LLWTLDTNTSTTSTITIDTTRKANMISNIAANGVAANTQISAANYASAYNGTAANYTGQLFDATVATNNLLATYTAIGPSTPLGSGGGAVVCTAAADVLGLTATPSSTQVSLSWTAVSGASSYQICQSTTNGTCSTSFTSSATSATNSATISGLTNGTIYYFTVKAVASCGTASANASSQVSGAPAIPPPPTCPGFATVTDNSGSIIYNTVWIDINQNGLLNTGECWIKENLATTKKHDGVTNLSHGAGGDYLCPPNVIMSAEDCAVSYSGSTSIMGNIYTWASAMNLASSCNTSDCSGQITSPHRGICPSGWHISTDGEWANVINYAENIAASVSGSTCATSGTCNNAGRVLKEIGTTYWNDLSTPAATNYLGLTLRGSGYYESNAWSSRGTQSDFWTATQVNSNNAYFRYFYFTDSSAGRSSYLKASLYSVRCVKN